MRNSFRLSALQSRCWRAYARRAYGAKENIWKHEYLSIRKNLLSVHRIGALQDSHVMTSRGFSDNAEYPEDVAKTLRVFPQMNCSGNVFGIVHLSLQNWFWTRRKMQPEKCRRFCAFSGKKNVSVSARALFTFPWQMDDASVATSESITNSNSAHDDVHELHRSDF